MIEVQEIIYRGDEYNVVLFLSDGIAFDTEVDEVFFVCCII